MKKFFSITLNTLLILVLIGIGGLFAAATLPIPGAIEIKIVKSGSMEPTIQTGGIVVIQPAASYAVNDVITYGKDTATEIPTTHRILDTREENGTTYFTTKGDANEERDANEVAASEVIGKVLFTVPYVGYLVDFARQPLGFILLIAVPAGLVILHEVMGIIEEVLRRKRGEKHPPKNSGGDAPPSGGIVVKNGREERLVYTRQSVMEDIYRPELMLVGASRTKWPRLPFAVLVFAAPFTVSLLGGTASQFYDRELSTESLLAASSIDFGVDADMPRAINLSITGYGEEHGTALAPYIEDYVGGAPIKYRIRAEEMGGDSAFCNALSLEGSAPLFDYDGPLLELSTGTTTDPSPWPLFIEAYDTGTPIADGTVCLVDLVYESETGYGYSDEERLSLLITYQNTTVIESSSAVESFSIEVPEEPPLSEEEETPPAEEPPQEEAPPEPTPEEPPAL